MYFSQPILDLIRKRISVRNYLPTIIDEETRIKINHFIDKLEPGPFGGKVRFKLLAATDDKQEELRNLGTYGFIKGATGYIVSAIYGEPKNLEDMGYLMEKIILYTTELGIGTCWLGGTFTKSSFASKMDLQTRELIPAVTAIGYPAPTRSRGEKLTRKKAGSDRRITWDQLFFKDTYNNPMAKNTDEFNLPLEMLRIAPSASNKQPWRVVKKGSKYHFYMHRTEGYKERRLNQWFTNADMQPIDMGIAMCHFELSAKELKLPGNWINQDPQLELPEGEIEYVVTWAT